MDCLGHIQRLVNTEIFLNFLVNIHILCMFTKRCDFLRSELFPLSVLWSWYCLLSEISSSSNSVSSHLWHSGIAQVFPYLWSFPICKYILKTDPYASSMLFRDYLHKAANLLLRPLSLSIYENHPGCLLRRRFWGAIAQEFCPGALRVTLLVRFPSLSVLLPRNQGLCFAEQRGAALTRRQHLSVKSFYAFFPL